MTDFISRPFSKITQRVIPISRVRVTQSNDSAAYGWNVEYLPAGKSRWWWNWRVYRTEHTEETARLLADILHKERSVTLTSYENRELEI